MGPRALRRPLAAALPVALAAAAGLASAGLLASACAAAPGPKVVDFEPLPESSVAGVSNPHDVGGRPLCQRCHVRGTDQLVSHPIGLCVSCHAFGHENHPYDVVQAKPSPELPYLPGGRIACHTCHDPHDLESQRWGLRFAFNDLCLKCHVKH